MSDEKNLDSLVEKLRVMQSELSAEEKEEFKSMIELAVRSSAEINLEEERVTARGANFKRYKELMKPQSAHAIMLGQKLDDLLE